MMQWWRVDDQTSGQAVLVQADSQEAAVAAYLNDYPPDLYVYPATDWDVTDWLNGDDDQQPWVI